MDDRGPTRRRAIAGAAAAVAALAAGATVTRAARALDDAPGKNPGFTAAVIGHTGRGDYGHGLDLVFKGLPRVVSTAVADPDEKGRARAVERTGAQRSYADYREMLDKERPALVAVAPRWTDQRRAMLMAALDAGAHVFCEKPFVVTPADGDDVLALAARKKLKVAVAHQMRLAPAVAHLQRKIADGALGELLELRAWGKQDGRAGGEDLLVLGVHLFDLMRLLARGEPTSCSARVTWKGREITKADARPAGENIGPVAGDEVEASFAFPGGVTATFTSRGRLRELVGHWGIEVVGTKGMARILADIWPRGFYAAPPGRWTDAGRSVEWKVDEADPGPKTPPSLRGTAHANARLAEDWLAAILEDREPRCSGRDGAMAVGMAMAVYRSALAGARVRLPLEQRGHPLA